VNKFKNHIGTLLLLLIFAILSASTVAWTLNDKTPPAWDPADHISAGYDFYTPLSQGSLNGFVQEFFIEPHYYAPFVHLLTGMIFFLFGASRLSGIGVNFISLAVLLASVNWMSQALYTQKPKAFPEESAEPSSNERSKKDENQIASMTMGVLASLLAVSYHFSAWLLHDAFLDYPLMAIVAASFALLIRAGDFLKLKDAALFAVAAGIGMMTKQTFAFFLLMPAIYVTGRVLFSRNLKAIRNLALAGLLVLAISAIWYAPHLQEVIAIYQVNREAAINENEAPLYSIMSNLYYVHGIISPQIQLPFGFLFFGGLIYSLVRRRKESILLYLWLISGLVAFTMVANKDLRYTVPLLPAVAILSVCWVRDLRFTAGNKSRLALKLAPVALITVWCCASFYNAQWPSDGQGSYIDSPRFRWMVFARNYFGFDHRPLPYDWGIQGLVQAVDQDWRENQPSATATNKSPAKVQPAPTPSETVSPSTHQAFDDSQFPVLGVVVNLPQLNPSNVAMFVRFAAKERGAPPSIKVDWLTAAGSKYRLEGVDYLLVRTGLDKAEWLAPLERSAESIVKTPQFKRVAAFAIPLEDAEAVLYRRIQ
jgi:4-amino-4-deoxy-L-arabinose transferase-like glycosyltransferase